VIVTCLAVPLTPSRALLLIAELAWRENAVEPMPPRVLAFEALGTVPRLPRLTLAPVTAPFLIFDVVTAFFLS
jgi:hypothetical protein